MREQDNLDSFALTPWESDILMAMYRLLCQPSPLSRLPLHRLPRHRRLFLLGLAGGVSDCDGDFRDRAAVGSWCMCPARTGRQAIVAAQPGGCRAEDGSCRQDYGHGRLPVGWYRFGFSCVPLGRKYELASGLMEITYDTGAKVILQGPVTYEVESHGGYLSVGKLTGELEKKVEGGSGKSEEISLILNP